jgi:hypothetical protein
MVLISGVELAGMDVSVGIGLGVLVLVDCKVNVGIMCVSVGFAHPYRKSVQASNTETIPFIGGKEKLILTGSFPLSVLSLLRFPNPRSLSSAPPPWTLAPGPRRLPRAR